MKKKNVKNSPKNYSKNNYPYTITNCPGYKGYTPENLSHEVCSNCGSIIYYH